MSDAQCNTFSNPVLYGNFGDPSILRDGQDYFMVHATGIMHRAMLMWHSRDLVHWEPLYYVLDGFSGGAWAPELVKAGNRYYIYNFGETSGHWVTWTDDIRNGGWSVPRPLGKVKGIDPGHAIGEDGKRYLFMSKNTFYPLSDDGLSVMGEGTRVYDDWPIPEDWDIEGMCTESPKITRKDGWFYLTVAQGGTVGPPTGHCVVSWRARSLSGPWECSPHNPIVHTFSREEVWWSKGHGTLVDTPQGEWFLVYHGIKNGFRHAGRMTLMERVEWTSDGWWRLSGGSRADLPIPMPAGGERVSGSLPANDDFEGPALGLQWNMESGGGMDRVSLLPGGGLSIKGMGSSLHDTAALTMSMLSDAQEIEVTVMPGFGGEGGLCYAYNRQLSCGISAGRGEIKLYNRGKPWLRTSEKVVKYQGDSVRLRLKNDSGIVSPWYSLDGSSWKKINFCFDITSWNSNVAYGYGGVRPGLFAAGYGAVSFMRFRHRVIA